jgi:hypothetical protein
LEAADYRANITQGPKLLRYSLSLQASTTFHAIVHMLDDLQGVVDAGGFGEGFHEGIVPLK